MKLNFIFIFICENNSYNLFLKFCLGVNSKDMRLFLKRLQRSILHHVFILVKSFSIDELIIVASCEENALISLAH